MSEEKEENEDTDSDSTNKDEASGVIKTHEVDKVIDKMNSLNEMFGKNIYLWSIWNIKAPFHILLFK